MKEMEDSGIFIFSTVENVS